MINGNDSNGEKLKAILFGNRWWFTVGNWADKTLNSSKETFTAIQDTNGIALFAQRTCKSSSACAMTRWQ